MAEIVEFSAGGYRYIRAGFQYSSGVAAQPGFQLERARFARALPLADGFAAAGAHLTALGRPLTALAACELRSPAPLTEQGFTEFNRQYVQTLERWGIYKQEMNPVARTNVCPGYGAPSAPALQAFSYTVPAEVKRGTFIIAGAGEVRDGPGSYLERVVRQGETSTDALRDKLRCVLAKMNDRLAALGFNWTEAILTQAYTVFDIGPLAAELARTGIAREGLVWHFSRPPLLDVDYEMDVRSAARELVL